MKAVAIFVAGIVTTICSAGTPARAGTEDFAAIQFAFAATPYTVSPTCDLSKPLAILDIALRNGGSKTIDAHGIDGSDGSAVLTGTVSMPKLHPGGTAHLEMPLLHDVSSVAPLGGSRTVTLSLGVRTLGTIAVAIPACGPAAATSAPTGFSATSDVVNDHSRAAAVFTPSALARQQASATAGSRATLFALDAPARLRSAGGYRDCRPHEGRLDEAVCKRSISAGTFALVWDLTAGAVSAIDGYHLYLMTGLSKLPTVAATVPDGTQTIAFLTNGLYGQCYALKSFAGARESAFSNEFCVPTTHTVVLQPWHVRSSERSGHGGTRFGTNLADGSLQVGFSYSSSKNVLGADDYDNHLERSALAFDLTPLRIARVLRATVRLRIARSAGAGNNASCATAIGDGTEFWWQSDANDWIEGNFTYDVAPGTQGPEVDADVTPIVYRWLDGSPNYGLVLKNADENIDAFTNEECVTTYTNASLAVTYY